MFIQSRIWTIAKTNQGHVVLLRPMDSNVVVPIFIGPLEAESILIGIAHVSTPRPNTHQLMADLFGSLHLKLMRIEISDIQEGVFYAVLHLQSEETELRQDSRPSDAIALAVRERCPIFISDAVVDEAGITLEDLVETEVSPGENFSDGEADRLKEALEKAVSEENYEEAAQLRDRLKLLDENSFNEEG